MMSERNYKGHIVMLIANVIWGINTPVSKSIMPVYLPAGGLNYFRIVGAALLFWTVSLFVKSEKVSRHDLILLVFAALFGIVLNQVLFLRGLSMTAPIEASIVATMAPIITMIVSALYLKEPITWVKVVGVLIGLSGAVLLVTGSLGTSSGSGNMWGNALCLLACFFYAIYLTVFKGLINRYSPVTLMKWMFLYSAVICTPVFWGDVVGVDYASLPVDAYLRIGYVVVFATFIAYTMIPIGQKNLRPTTLSMYNYVQPLIASLAAVFMGLDHFGLTKTIAAVLVFLGVYVVTQSKSRAQIEAERKMADQKRTLL